MVVVPIFGGKMGAVPILSYFLFIPQCFDWIQ